MQDPKDPGTLDLLPAAPRRRGRPSTGKPLSAAERKRMSRRVTPLTADSCIEWSAMSKTALIECLTTKKRDVYLGRWEVFHALFELAGRAGLNVTVTQENREFVVRLPSFAEVSHD